MTMPIAGRRLRVTTGLAVLAALAITVGSMTLTGARAQDDPAPGERVGMGVIEAPAPQLLERLADCSDVAALGPGEAIAVADGVRVFAFAGEPSEARYLSEEQLVGIGANTAVGRTNAVIGQILVDGAGQPVPCSRFDVDMRTLQSDSARRDNYLYRNTLQSEQFPLATFVLRAVDGLDGPLTSDPQPLMLIGDLTIRDVTLLVAWEAEAAIDDDRLSGQAALEFDMADFQIVKPIVGSVLSIEDVIRLEVDIEAEAAG